MRFSERMITETVKTVLNCLYSVSYTHLFAVIVKYGFAFCVNLCLFFQINIFGHFLDCGVLVFICSVSAFYEIFELLQYRKVGIFLACIVKIFPCPVQIFICSEQYVMQMCIRDSSYPFCFLLLTVSVYTAPQLTNARASHSNILPESLVWGLSVFPGSVAVPAAGISTAGNL